jgi:hypothetical protein
MHVTHCRVDISACLARKQKPAAVIERRGAETWLVADAPVRMDQPIQWANTAHGESVHIPMVPYLTHHEPDLSLAFMLQLGVKIGAEIGRPVKQLHIATGHPVNEVRDAGGYGLQYFMGFGVVLED